MKLRANEIELIIEGAALFGSGGGGSKKNAEKFLADIRERDSEIELVTEISEIESDKLGCVICDIGSNSSSDPNQIEALEFALEALENNYDLGGKIEYLFPIESGPENTLAPIVLASRKDNLKVIDADGGGRAVPKLSLTLYSFDDNKSRPTIMSNGINDLVVTSKEVTKLEEMLRDIVKFKQFNSSASLALWPDKVKALYDKSFKGPILRSYYCGMLLKGLRENDQALVNESLPHLNDVKAYLIGSGVVIDKDIADDTGFDRIETTLFNKERNEILTIFSQNENLVVYSNRNNKPLAIAPDSICYLDSSFYALTNAKVLDPNVQSDKPNKLKQLDMNEEMQELYLIGIKVPNEISNNKDLMNQFDHVLKESKIKDVYQSPINCTPLGNLLVALKTE